MPWVFVSVHHKGMPAPRITIQAGKIVDQARPEWIEVNVTDQFLEIDLLIAKDRFVAVLEKVAFPFVSAVVIDGVSR